MQNFKLHRLPEEDEEHMTLQEYEAYLRENVLSPLHALKVGCFVVVISGKAIWHEARTAHPNKGHEEALQMPNDSLAASQLKVLAVAYAT